jgi:hypothetical protein
MADRSILFTQLPSELKTLSNATTELVSVLTETRFDAATKIWGDTAAGAFDPVGTSVANLPVGTHIASAFTTIFAGADSIRSAFTTVTTELNNLLGQLNSQVGDVLDDAGTRATTLQKLLKDHQNSPTYDYQNPDADKGYGLLRAMTGLVTALSGGQDEVVNTVMTGVNTVANVAAAAQGVEVLTEYVGGAISLLVKAMGSHA